MTQALALNQYRASFFCASFAKDDARIERALGAIEATIGRKLSHYVDQMAAPKRIPGDRTAFVSQWLPGPAGKARSQLLCPKGASDQYVFVSLDNLGSFPELGIRPGGSFNGTINITFAQSAPFGDRIVKRFADLVGATECFYAALKAPPLNRQEGLTRQRYAAILQDIEKRAAISEALAESDRKVLARQAPHYVYELDERSLSGLVPNGTDFLLRLHWLNYWNDATAQRLRFPDDALDGRLRGMYEHLPGGWLVRLTPEPPDLDKPADRERLEWAYRRLAGEHVS